MNGVQANELLARFIFSKQHFSRENNRVKHNAFLPTPEGETSVSRIDTLDENAVWTIGQEVASVRQQMLYGRGDIKASRVFSIGLNVVPTETPPHHANIVKWPAEKSEQKLRAMELAGAAKLVLTTAS